MPRLVLHDATVLDADGARPHTTVVVEDRRIALVRSAADANEGALGARPEDRVVDLAGRTVMPSMVSSHGITDTARSVMRMRAIIDAT